MYDSRIGRWFARDPLENKYPDISPYASFGDNPILFVDPDGKFLLDVHQRIAKNALKGFKISFNEHIKMSETLKNNWARHFTNSFNSGIRGNRSPVSGGVTWPDLHDEIYGANKSSHFDSMDYEQIISNMNRINKDIVGFVDNALKKRGNGNVGYTLGNSVGNNLHAVEDLYSHSNFVELYKDVYGETDISSIPTLKEAISAGNAKNATKLEKQFAESLKANLKTGDYPGTGKDSHLEMNHDVGSGSAFTDIMPETKGKKVTWNTRAAEAVATKASKEYLNSVKEEVQSR